MIIHNVEQGSIEWLQLRLGKLTASNFHILMGKGETRKTILYKIAAERITGVASDSDKFTSIHTDRGHEQEDYARTLYELETGNLVQPIGFCELSNTVGCSPDGLVGQDGGIEIKCKDNHGYLKAITTSYIAPEHRTQMQFCMYVTDRQWWDYVLFNPNFSKPLFTIRVERDDFAINQIINHIDICEVEIMECVNKYNSGK